MVDAEQQRRFHDSLEEGVDRGGTGERGDRVDLFLSEGEAGAHRAEYLHQVGLLRFAYP
ncbi:hypothetical protein SDC9_201756 [bioreactor metagenome]|uniref:Uncharacterized protein n=1 Tax=bioreactor metagenome TaxID=1076179 RepID=A0A645IS88_9ZZZZ